MNSFFRDHRYFFFLLAVYVVFAAAMLNHYPRVWVDEPWVSITGYTLETEGRMYNPVLENLSGFDKIFLQPRLVLSIAMAPTFKLFGVGYLQGRMVSVLCGGLLLLSVYLLTSRLFSKRTALLAVWFVIIETMMFISYRTIREEIYLVMFESFSLMFFFKGLRSQMLRDFFWSGLLSGIALWTHPNAVLHVCALGVIALLFYKNEAFTSRFTWTFVGALLLGITPYLVYLIVNDAHDLFSTFILQLGDRTNTLSRQNWFFTSLSGEWNRVVEYSQFPFRVPIIFIFVAAWLAALVSKKMEKRYIAIMICVHAILSFFLITNKTIYYSTSVLPLLCILTASGIDELLGAPQKITIRLKRIFSSHHWRETAGVCVFVVLSLNQVAGDASLLWRNRNCSYSDTIQELQSVIPRNARVWGSMTFWFGFYQHPYRSQYTLFKELESFKPEYMIIGDPEVWQKDLWRDVREKAEKTVQARGTLVAEFPESCYGALRVYRLQW